MTKTDDVISTKVSVVEVDMYLGNLAGLRPGDQMFSLAESYFSSVSKSRQLT